MTEGQAPESIEDVRAMLAEVRQTLEEVNDADLSDPNAVILVEPLLELRAQLLRIERDIREVIDMKRGGEN